MSDYTVPTDAFSTELVRIRGLIAHGQLQQAAVALNAAQQAGPRDARVPLLGMRLADAVGNAQGATRAARRALELAPEWPVAMIELALALAREGKDDEAWPLARQAAERAPRDVPVLGRCLAVAERVEANEPALEWARTAQALSPNNPRFPLFIGRFLAARKRYDEALEQFEAVLRGAPENVEALRGALTCALDLKRMDVAREFADRLLALQPDDETVRYFHGRAHGEMPATQPRDVVSTLFDDYAERFDMHLVRGLKYRVPERAAELLVQRFPDRRFNLLDLGCGTGLLGVYLGPIEGFIIGVDLSEKMLEQAARHNVYARFHHVNVLDALRDTPSDLYEAIASLDVLVYVGDLSPVIPNAFRILKAGGVFIFTCESAAEDEADMVLRPSQRYAHKASHVERLCREAGFDPVTIEHLPALRMESGEPLPGFLVVAHKPEAA